MFIRQRDAFGLWTGLFTGFMRHDHPENELELFLVMQSNYNGSIQSWRFF